MPREGRSAVEEGVVVETLEELEAEDVLARLHERLRGEGPRDGGNRFELTGKRVVGTLDLGGLKLPFPVLVRQCRLDDVKLVDAELDTLQITGTTCAGIRADRLKARGLLLDKGFHCEGEVWLPDVTIEGDLNCSEGCFDKLGGRALCLDGARVGGRIFLRRAECNGAVTAVNARCEGGFSANDSHFSNADGNALDLERIQVNGWVFLRKSHLQGALKMPGAAIRSDVHLHQMTVTGVPLDRPGIDLDRIVVEGRLVLRGVHSSGRTRLRNATIGKGVEAHGAHLRGTSDGALAASGATVHGRVDLRGAFNARGGVKLAGCTIDGDVLLDDESFVRANDNTPGLDLSRAQVGGSVIISGTLRGAPALSLTTTQVAGDLELRRGVFKTGQRPPSGYKEPVAIRGEGLMVSGTMLAQRMYAGGLVSLRRLHVIGDVYLTGARFKQRAIFDSAMIGGRLLLVGTRLGAAEGEGFSLVGAKVNGHLRWRPHGIEAATEVNLARTHVAYLDDKDGRWPTGGLQLDGFTYDDIRGIEPTGTWIDGRLRWIRGYTRTRFSPQPYEQLLGVLRRGGHEKHARKVARAKQDDLRRHGELPPLTRGLNWLLGKALGHGYAVSRALAAALVLIVVGTLTFWWGHDQGQLEAISDGPAPEFFPLAYALDMLLPIVDLDQASEWRPLHGISLYYSWFHIGAGWVLATLIGLGLTGLVKKD